MILQKGDCLMVVHRRLFPNDTVRFFTCEVDEYENGLVRVTGHSWVRDTIGGRTIRKDEKRTKMLSLSSGTLIVYRLPAEARIATLGFEEDGQGGTWLIDGAGFRMDLREHWAG